MQLPNIQDLDPDQLYDLIMVNIEPELCTYNLHELQVKYVNESKEELAARKKRYDKAFNKHERVKNEYFGQIAGKKQQEQAANLQQLEAESRQDEQQVLQDLELLFN